MSFKPYPGEPEHVAKARSIPLRTDPESRRAPSNPTATPPKKGHE